MSGIDRRSLIKMAGAGAGLLMAGTARAQCQDAADESGGCNLHGQAATDPGPEAEGASVKTFDPDYICVIYMRFDERRLKVRTAYVRPPKPFQVASIVRPILLALRNNGNVAAIRKEVNFENLTFGSPHLLVMYLDNDPDDIGFDDRFGEEYIVRFTPLRGSDPTKPARKNHAFYNLERIEFTNPAPLRSRFAYKLEFWNTNINGDFIVIDPNCPETHHIYSMNIHLKMAVEADQEVWWVPLILDPDTGNTGGDP